MQYCFMDLICAIKKFNDEPYILKRRRMTMSIKNVSLVGLLMAFVLVVLLGTPVAAAPPAEAQKAPSAQLIQAAKSEGAIVSYGLPNSWVNYGGLLQGFTKEYGITYKDTDMDSGTIISTLIAEAKTPVADTTDLGLAFAKLVEDKTLSQPFMNSYWNEIPGYAKDPKGRWSAAFYGVMAFLVNADKVKNVPKTWDDLLKPEYKGTLCMRDPRSSATAQMIVLASAFANGGSETNVQPGLDFFKKMIDRGILNGVSPSSANIQKGECPIAIQWDFDALRNKDQNQKMNLQAVIPSDGTVAGLYIQFATAGAPHPNAAKLLLEYEYSDKGQLAYAQGFAHPIRTSVKLPAELLAKFPPAAAYKSVSFPKDYVALDKAGSAISDGWTLIAK
jgi:putative spermidine/putrescine transport system substrate-binding protein